MTQPVDASVDEVQGQTWDVVIVGAGAGGATAGYALARAGRSVLFLERGRHIHRDADVTRGEPYEWNGNATDAIAHGWWPEPLYLRAGDRHAPTYLPIGCGTAGTTGVFGMVMDRLKPADFTPRAFHRDAEDSTLPDAWPITYEELEPYYEEAERLYRVHGTPDPLTPSRSALLAPPPPTPQEAAVTDALTRVGLHPFRVPYAQDKQPDCNGCPAHLCPRACRNDASRVCLQPAIEQHGARLLTGCTVTRLTEANGRVQSAVCRVDQREIQVRAKIFVVAANAFLTPALLQRSTSDRFPNGLGNNGGLVGRNLMVHVSDVLLLRLKDGPTGGTVGMNHGLSLNDFYIHREAKLGNIHAHPVAVAPDAITAYLRLHMKWVNRMPAGLLNAAARTGAWLHRASTVFATVLEDLPYASNRVSAGAGDRVEYEYTYPDELRRRGRQMFDAFTHAVRGQFRVFQLQPLGSLNLGHVCGTCRFGTEPRTSVLDRDNRVHDLDNLYVLDASFFPSSGGINPSLTIAANSLRVSDKIVSRL